MLSPLRRNKLSRKFQLFDGDSNGFVERADFERAVENLASLRGWGPRSNQRDDLHARYALFWDALQKHADSDADDRVTLEEWLHYHDLALEFESEIAGLKSAESGATTALAAFVFDAFDDDDDGVISGREFGQFCAVYRIDDDPDSLFSRLDGNSDGTITKQEMMELVAEFYFSDDPKARGNWLFGDFQA